MSSLSSSSPSATSTQQELKQQGNVHFQNDDFEKAIDFYTLAINLDPAGDATVPILSNRSLCYYNIGKYKEAYEDAGCCCGLKPDWAKGFARRGFAAMKLEEFEIALESFDEYLKLTNENDEMGVAEPRHRAAKEVKAAKSRESAALRAAHAADEKLKSIADEDERYAHACFMFYEGARNFVKNKETLKVVAKYCRLDTPFVLSDQLDSLTLDHFSKINIEKARGALQEPSVVLPLISTLGAVALCAFYNTVCNYHYEHLIEGLDFFADLAENEENYSPLNAEGENDSEFEMKKRAQLCIIVFYDNNLFCTVLMKKFLVDFVLTLLNRGKLLFFGKNTKMSNKEFASRLFREVIGEACDSRTKQETYDCLLALIDAGANVNGLIPNSGLEQLPTLAHAVWCHSVKIIELLLRHGADSKFIGGGRLFRCALLEALEDGQLDIAQLLFLNGAELETEETPKLAFERTDNDPRLKLCATLLKPRMGKSLKRLFFSKHFVKKSSEVKEGAVSLVFRALKAQNLSLYFDDGHKCLETPLTALVRANASPQFIRHIVNLMDAASINASRSISLSESSQGRYDALALAAMRLTTTNSKLIDNFKEIARILLEGGFDYDRAKADVGRWYPFLVEPLLNKELIDYCESVNAEVKAKRNPAK